MWGSFFNWIWDLYYFWGALKSYPPLLAEEFHVLVSKIFSWNYTCVFLLPQVQLCSEKVNIKSDQIKIKEKEVEELLIGKPPK